MGADLYTVEVGAWLKLGADIQNSEDEVPEFF